jgi:hypothetical protein
MKNQVLIKLINRAAAVIETPADFTEDEIQDLLDNLDAAALELEDQT